MLAVHLHAKVRKVFKLLVTERERIHVEQHTESKMALKLTSKDSKDLAQRHLYLIPYGCSCLFIRKALLAGF